MPPSDRALIDLALYLGQTLAAANRCIEPGVDGAGDVVLRQDLGAHPHVAVLSDEMVRAFDARREVIVRGLNALPGVRCRQPVGAFYAFPNIEDTGMDARTLQNRLLEETGIATVAGTSFGAHGEGFIRFSYANSVENIENALERMRMLLGN